MVRLSPLPLAALLLPSLIAAQSTILPSPPPPPPPPSEAACNNSPDLCSRSYSNITHIGAHNSAFLRDASTGNSIAGNQYYNATLALSSGLRLLQAQVHLHDNTLKLCHTLCDLLDAGPLETFLSSMASWLSLNPNEVITLLLVNSDSQPITSFASLFESSSLSQYGFIPTNNTTIWPTLSEMISLNHRLVTFITNITPSPSSPYLLPEFSYIFETPFNNTSPSSFTCTLDRPLSAGAASAALSSGLLPLLNHFLYVDLSSGIQIPNVDSIDSTNSPDLVTTGSLGRHAELCSRQDQWGTKPVFVLVDFFNRGPATETGDRLNGIQGKTVGRTTLPAEGSGGAAVGAATGDAAGARGNLKAFGALVGFLGVALVVP